MSGQAYRAEVVPWLWFATGLYGTGARASGTTVSQVPPFDVAALAHRFGTARDERAGPRFGREPQDRMNVGR